MVFIVGCPRSGTTWLQRLLASHPDVRTGQESDLFTLYMGPLLRAWRENLDESDGARGGLGLACYHTEAEFMRALRQFLETMMRPMTASVSADQVFIEKTPGHALFLREIFELLPGARVIHLVRDPRDVVASLLAAAGSWGASWAPRSAAHAAYVWEEHVAAARAAGAATGRDHYLEATYERLRVDTLGEVERISRFIGLRWEEDALASAVEWNTPKALRETGGTPIKVHGQFGGDEGRVAVDPDGFVRKATTGAWRRELSMMDKVRVWRALRRRMAEFGYPWPHPLA